MPAALILFFLSRLEHTEVGTYRYFTELCTDISYECGLLLCSKFCFISLINKVKQLIPPILNCNVNNVKTIYVAGQVQTNPNISAQQNQYRTFRRNIIVAGQNRRRPKSTQAKIAQAKIGAG